MEGLTNYDLFWISLYLGFGFGCGIYGVKAFNALTDYILERAGVDFFPGFEKQSHPITEYPERLRAARWGDGQQSDGTVNIFCDEWQTVIAHDVQKQIAVEMVRRYNRGPK